MDRQEVIDIGFKELPHFTITNALIYDIGRNRHLSYSCIREANEMLFICQRNHKNPEHIDDLVCLHNYDYDGLMTKKKINDLNRSINQ